MLQSKSFVKKTKKGKVMKVVREHYLRDDIYSGSPLDPDCDPASHKLSAEAPQYTMIDTNIALHQMDLLEHTAITDVVIPSIVLDEVRARNASAYQRLRALIASPTKRFYVFSNEHHRDTYIKADPGESPNDRNDRAIRVAAAWYTQRMPTMRIVLLTDDSNSRRLANEMGVVAVGTREFCEGLTEAKGATPDLLDLVAVGAGTGAGGSGSGGVKGSGAGGTTDGDTADGTDGTGTKMKSKTNKNKRTKVYDEHKPLSEITAGLKAGRYHQGSLRVNRFNTFEGWIGSESVGEDILIRGRVAMNRAMDGDVVAVEVLPEDEWMAPSTQLPSAKENTVMMMDLDENEEEGNEEKEGEAPAHIAGPLDDVGGDTVVVKGGEKRPTGRVIGIIKRNWRSRGYCGSLQPPKELGPQYQNDRTTNALFVPVERRFPFIRIQTRQAKTLSDKRIVVAIDSWDVDSLFPTGHYVRTLGDIGDKDVETEVLLIENDINTAPFSPAVHACVPPLPWSVTEQDLKDLTRTDLRHLAVCSVDPPGCKDIDDALHVRRLENGNWEVGVHIADVTHFVLPGSAMDVEASNRATTTYLVQRRIDMLPKPLTEDICSLRAGVERLTFSVMWEMTEQGEVVSTRFTKGIIRSRAALTYAEAQSRIDDARLTDEITENLRVLNKIAKILRKKRTEGGALSLASPEVKFEIDTETHDPLDVGMYQMRETNQMVEEMMLLANCTVAAKCLSSFPACSLLRRHPTPPPRQFEPLLRAAAAVGISIDPATSKLLAESLDKAVRGDDPYFNKLIRIMATRCMTQAVYLNSGEMSVAEYYHYGLAAPLYTHFTSPIRRYADVVVHRVLMAALGLQPLPENLRDRQVMHPVVDNLNVRHRNAQLAGRASVELHTLIFFKERTVIADARVTRVKSNGMIVFVPKFGIEGPLYFTPASAGQEKDAGTTMVFDEEKQTVRNTSGTIKYTIFDPCAVKIFVNEGVGRRRVLVLELMDRGELPDDEKVVV